MHGVVRMRRPATVILQGTYPELGTLNMRARRPHTRSNRRRRGLPVPQVSIPAEVFLVIAVFFGLIAVLAGVRAIELMIEKPDCVCPE